jgi:hypothetical protein
MTISLIPNNKYHNIHVPSSCPLRMSLWEELWIVGFRLGTGSVGGREEGRTIKLQKIIVARLGGQFLGVDDGGFEG